MPPPRAPRAAPSFALPPEEPGADGAVRRQPEGAPPAPQSTGGPQPRPGAPRPLGSTDAGPFDAPVRDLSTEDFSAADSAGGVQIVALCRFSYIGWSDWVGLRDLDSLLDPAARAALLFHPDRMARRFKAFEALCLGSLRAQTDPDFRCLVLVSDLMPSALRDRLEALCAPVPQVTILEAPPAPVTEICAAALLGLTLAQDRPLLQVRLDDDDALAATFMARLRAHAARFADLESYAITFANGLVASAYPDEASRFLRWRRAFLGAGLAARMPPGKTIFGINHYRMAERLTSFSDMGAPGWLNLRWDSDSAPTVEARFPPSMTEMRPREARRALAQDFPWLEGFDFNTLRQP